MAGSTPVVWFGSYATAWVATVGLNPSSVEFIPVPRLATTTSLMEHGTPIATARGVRQVVAACDAYFQRDPYWDWFSVLEEQVLKGLGASYLDGRACHSPRQEGHQNTPGRGALALRVRQRGSVVGPGGLELPTS